MYDDIMPVLKKMGRFLSPTNTENNYSNMHKTYAKENAEAQKRIKKLFTKKGDPSKNRSKVGKNFR